MITDRLIDRCDARRRGVKSLQPERPATAIQKIVAVVKIQGF